MIHRMMISDGAKNAEAGGAGRKVGQNMLLKKSGAAASAAGAKTGAAGSGGGGSGGAFFGPKCGICKTALHQPGAYCNNCAYKKGICSMCGG